MKPIIRYWPSLVFLAMASLATSAAVAQQPVLTKSYPISPTGSFRFAQFTSEVSCGFGCSITHRIHSANVDRLVVVKWLDRSGSPLMDQVANAYWSNFFDPIVHGGYLSASEWQWKGITNVAKDMGTADFTGTSPGTNPCGVGYVCGPPNGPEYYYFPPLFPAPTSGGGGGNAPARLAAPAASYDTISTTLSGVLLNPDFTLAQDANGTDLRAAALTFSSDVEEINGEFHYVYTVSNATDLAIPVTWAAGAIDGDVPALGSLQKELVSSLAPRTQNSATSYILDKQYGGGAVVYAPVPEPNTLLMFAAGLLVLLTARLGAEASWPAGTMARASRWMPR